jgi:hypothetical protein
VHINATMQMQLSKSPTPDRTPRVSAFEQLAQEATPDSDPGCVPSPADFATIIRQEKVLEKR